MSIERMEELVSSSTSSNSLLRNDDSDKEIMQGKVIDKKDQRKGFSISLSREEIEEDFIAMMGRKPNPNPTKRPKAVQKQLDALFPGSRLSEVLNDMHNEGQSNFQMPISEDKKVMSERMEELVGSPTSSKPLFGKDDPSKELMQGTVVNKNDRRMKFSISLTPEEIEEDFIAMTGKKPNPNPTKRPIAVQKKLDALFPGSRLLEVLNDLYEIDE